MAHESLQESLKETATPPPPETPAQSVAQGLFGLALLALIIHALSTLALALAPRSPSGIFAQVQTGLVVAFIALTVLNLALAVYTLRVPLDRLAQRLMPLERWLSARLCLFVLVALLLVNLLAWFALHDVAPLIIAPLRFWLAGMTLVFALLAFSLHRATLSAWQARTQSTWAGIGYLLTGALTLALLAIGMNGAVESSGINDRLRGALDYRPLSFMDSSSPDSPPPSAPAFWTEQSQTRVRWSPFSYWVVDAFEGQYINVDANGLRQTAQFSTDDAQVETIAFFGGSTLWGEGARDAYTIPSQVSRLLADAGTPQRVLNYGQTGYVIMQDSLLFQAQLLQGRAPQVAVFYGGFNDLLAAYGAGMAGVSLQENERLADSESGRLLRSGQPLLRPLAPALSQYDFSLLAASSASAEDIVGRWWATTDLLRALCDAYQVRCLFVWQPFIAFKSSLSDFEQGILERLEQERPDFITLYQQADALVRQRAQASAPTDLLILSDLFSATPDSLFYDLIHITEFGNRAVAEALLPHVVSRLTDAN